MIEDLQEREVLCCCEFVNNKEEKSHLLAVCCDCEEFDLLCTRCITCTRNQGNIHKMLLTFQDRLRIPWRGGAKQVSCSAIGPALAIPISIAFGALNLVVTIIMFLSNLAFLSYAYYYVRREKIRTSFFPLWILWSVVYVFVLFQFTVPLLEVLPEENFVLVLLTGGAVLCLYCTFMRAALNQVIHKDLETTPEDAYLATTLLIEPEQNTGKIDLNACKRCARETLVSATHCDVCGHCVVNRRHHSFWLNCCIGASNYRRYMIGLVLAELALLLGANLTLTAICHPVLMQRIAGISVMIPDDCSEVYDEYSFGVAFIIAVYALILAFFVLLECARQVFKKFCTTFWHKNEQSHLPRRKSIVPEKHSFVP